VRALLDRGGKEESFKACLADLPLLTLCAVFRQLAPAFVAQADSEDQLRRSGIARHCDPVALFGEPNEWPSCLSPFHCESVAFPVQHDFKSGVFRQFLDLIDALGVLFDRLVKKRKHLVYRTGGSLFYPIQFAGHFFHNHIIRVCEKHRHNKMPPLTERLSCAFLVPAA